MDGVQRVPKRQNALADSGAQPRLTGVTSNGKIKQKKAKQGKSGPSPPGKLTHLLAHGMDTTRSAAQLSARPGKAQQAVRKQGSGPDQRRIIRQAAQMQAFQSPAPQA